MHSNKIMQACNYIYTFFVTVSHIIHLIGVGNNNFKVSRL